MEYVSKGSQIQQILERPGKVKLNPIITLYNTQGILSADYQVDGCMYRLHRNLESEQYIDIIYELNKYLREYIGTVYKGLSEELKLC